MPRPEDKDELSRFLDHHFQAGTGNKAGRRWVGKDFAEAASLNQGRLSSIRTGKEDASIGNLEGIEKALFPTAAQRNRANPDYSRWLGIRTRYLGLTRQSDAVDTPRYSARDVWNLMLNPIRENSVPIIREGGGQAVAPYFRHADIQFTVLPKRFILPVPEWFRAWLRARGEGQYELHDPIDFTGSPELKDFYAQVPIPGLQGLIDRHSDAYAREVQNRYERISTFPPYNKEKLGLYAYQQPQRANEPERAYMAFWLYETDYFTHRVMRRVLNDIRASRPQWFAAQGDFFEEVGDFLRYFTTSFGLNLVVTTTEKSVRQFHMVRLATAQGNENQRRSIHVSANEGLNTDDVSADQVDLQQYAARTLLEELGITSEAMVESTVYLEFAMEMRNFEPYISGLTHLRIDGATLAREKAMHARDDRRETTEFLSFPFSELGMVDMLIENARGTADFSSYALLILDGILSRGLASLPDAIE